MMLSFSNNQDNNSFLVKRNGKQFSREKYNLRNLNSYKVLFRDSVWLAVLIHQYSGLVNAAAVDLSAGTGSSVRFNLKKSGASYVNKPASHPTNGVLNKVRPWATYSVETCVLYPKDYRKGAAAVKAVVSSYRADLTGDALARFNQLKKINSRPATLPTKRPRRRNAKA